MSEPMRELTVDELTKALARTEHEHPLTTLSNRIAEIEKLRAELPARLAAGDSAQRENHKTDWGKERGDDAFPTSTGELERRLREVERHASAADGVITTLAARLISAERTIIRIGPCPRAPVGYYGHEWSHYVPDAACAYCGLMPDGTQRTDQ